MMLWRVAFLVVTHWAVTVTPFAMPKLPGLYSPELCLPMTDHSYPGDPDGDLSQEVILANWNQETLFCKRGCCGDSKEAECCPPEAEEGLGTFQLISIVAAGLAGVTVVTVISLYFVKIHNKKKVLVGDISTINKMNKNTGKGGPGGHGEKPGRLGQYEKSPAFKNSQQQGQLFRKTNSPPDMKRPKTPISMVSPPDILPTITAGPLPKLNQSSHLPSLNQPSQKQNQLQQEPLIANLKAPSPPAATIKSVSPAPSPPLPANLPPPLISAPFKTAEIDDDFIDTILASIPLDDPAVKRGK